MQHFLLNPIDIQWFQKYNIMENAETKCIIFLSNPIDSQWFKVWKTLEQNAIFRQ